MFAVFATAYHQSQCHHHCHYKMATQQVFTWYGAGYNDVLLSVFDYKSSFNRQVILHAKLVVTESHQVFSVFQRIECVIEETSGVLV